MAPSVWPWWETTIEAAHGRVRSSAGVASTSTLDAGGAGGKHIKSSAPTGFSRSWRRIFRSPMPRSNPTSARLRTPVDIPVVIYTNPQFQRSDLSLDCIERLASHPRIGYIKDASTNTGGCSRSSIAAAIPSGCFPLPPHIPAAVMLIGGVGWMAGPACIIPRQSVALLNSARPRAGTRRSRSSANCGGSTRPSRATISPPASRPRCRSRAMTPAIPVPPQKALTAEERKAGVKERVLREVG